MLVELKNGETLNGHLVTCDTWMNLTLKEVVQTSPVRLRQLLAPNIIILQDLAICCRAICFPFGEFELR
jgi:small nuclear ribonucleoprotein (snRNP)-like protein